MPVAFAVAFAAHDAATRQNSKGNAAPAVAGHMHTHADTDLGLVDNIFVQHAVWCCCVVIGTNIYLLHKLQYPCM